MSQPQDEEEYYTIPTAPAIPTDYDLHNEDTPFCYDSTCGCHEDPDLIGPVNQGYQDGLITAENATDIVNGHTV